MGKLNYYANAWLPARDILISSVAAGTNVDPSGKILLFEQFLPWKVCLLSLPVPHFFQVLLTASHRNISSSSKPNLPVRILQKPST